MPQTKSVFPDSQNGHDENASRILINGESHSPGSANRSGSSSFSSSQRSNGEDNASDSATELLQYGTSTPNPHLLFPNGTNGQNLSLSSSNISATEENYECIAEGTNSCLFTKDEHSSLPYSPKGSGPGKEVMGHRRWGSFRASPGSGGKRPVVTSSSALANQLYRSSSFHSCGRSSAGDPEEMYSDGSLEDEVSDLTQKVYHLEEKFSVLAENQTDVDDRYVRIKQENTELSTKLFMAEELLRDLELRSAEKLKEEKRRSKDVADRIEREKQLHIENYDIRLRSAEKELEQFKSENARLRQKLERERVEKGQLQDKILDIEADSTKRRETDRAAIEVLRKERDTILLEASASSQGLQELKKEFENFRKQNKGSNGYRRGHVLRLDSADYENELVELKSRLNESEEENKRLKKHNKQLQEANEELSAQLLNHGLEEGRNLLTANKLLLMDAENSLAAEFEAMSTEQLKKALKEQTEVNDQLKSYIDGILLNIVENYPQLLEVKNKGPEDCSMENSS